MPWQRGDRELTATRLLLDYFRVADYTPRIVRAAQAIIARSMALISGTKLGPYEIQSPLGSGGMGEVYRAIQSSLGRQVAIKVLPAEKVADPERKQRFVQEAKSASSLNHPNIITIYDIGRPRALTLFRWSWSPVKRSTG